jgi:CBS domain-containing protein
MTDKNLQSAPEEFRDPLANYDPRDYRDTLEQALAEETVVAIQSHPYTSVPADSTVEQAIHLLANRRVACALVEENGKLTGVFSDRDVLNKVALEYEAMKHRPVRDVMTVNPVYVYQSDSPAAALCVMAVMGHRHVPVLDRDHRIVGIVTPHRITDFLLGRVDA